LGGNVSKLSIIVKAILGLTITCAITWSQATTAQINGTVRDSSGSSVPDAELKATQTATGVVRTATSGTDGSYVLTNLPIGPYMLEATKTGFSKYVQTGVVLQVDGNPTIDPTLKVGATSEQVTVSADAAMVETHSTGVGTVVDNQRVIELPLNGRNATDLVFLAGMATIGGSGFLNSVRNYPTVMISVTGGVGNMETFALDGANHNDAYNGLNLPLPFPDALQEFKVETSALPAQYGLHSSAAINAVTKSGTNEYHGDAFEFLRNGDLNARDFFALTRDSLKRNQFGGTVGGPVLPRFKNKLFFFAGFQGTIQKSNPASNLAFVPTPAELQGNFAAAAGPQCNGGKQLTLAPSLGFVNNTIAPALFNPAALKIDSFLPTPTNPCGQVQYGLLSNQSEFMGVARIDYTQNEKSTIFGRAYVTNLNIPSTFQAGNALTLNSNQQLDRVSSLALGNTYLFSSTLVNSFRVGVNRASIPKITDDFATWPQLGVNAPYNPAPAPRVAVTGNGFSIGSGNSIINHANTGPDLNIVEDLSWVKGSHQFGFGGSYLRMLINYVSGINATGLPSFNGAITGLSMADFLLGDAVTWTQGDISYFYNRETYVGLYAQDTWKPTSRLTVNYGVRWEPWLPIWSKESLFDRFDQGLFNQGVVSGVHVNAPAGLVFPGDPQWTSGQAVAKPSYNKFVPRVGLAWDPTGTGKMTVRAAFGSFTDRSGLYSLSSFGQDAPVGYNITLSSGTGGNGSVNLSNPWASYPGGNPLPVVLSKTMPFPTTGGAYITYPPNWQPVWVNQWNLSLQKQLRQNWLVTANYLGNDTTHLMTEDQLNPAVFLGTSPCTIRGTAYPNCGTTATTNQRRVLNLQSPLGAPYGIISLGAPEGTGSYNALFLSAQKRLSGGTTVLANYTWSHCISDEWNGQVGNTGVSSVTPNNRRNDRGNCSPNIVTTDQRQIFNLSVVATTPKFASRALRMLASDWQFSPIITIKSAQQFTVLLGVDQALNGETAQQRPNLVPGVSPYSGLTGCSPAPCIQMVNRAAFSTPALGTLGDLSIGSMKGPGVFQLDLAMSRTFRIWEKQTIQLRAEAFNLPNHVNPAIPGQNTATATANALNSGNFGQATSDISGTSGLSGGDYRIVQLVLKYFF
jgi:hypothetical protein